MQMVKKLKIQYYQIEILNSKNSDLQNSIKNKDKEITKLKDEIQKINISQDKVFENKKTQKNESLVCKPLIEEIVIKQDSLDSGFFPDEAFTPEASSPKGDRSKELQKGGIRKLKKIAKSKGITKLSNFKKDNIQDLIDMILEKEFN